MAGLSKWGTPEAWVDLFGASGASLNSLANNGFALSSEIDNTTLLVQYMRVSLRLASINPTGTPLIRLYLCELLDDGVTYNRGVSGTAPTVSDAAAEKQVHTGAGTVDHMFRNIWIPPNKFKIVLVNNMGVAIAASGNNCKYSLFPENNNG